MHYELQKSLQINAQECLVIGVFSDTLPAYSLSPQVENLVTKLANSLAEVGSWSWQSDINEHSLMVIQCGKQAEFNQARLQQCLQEIGPVVIKQPTTGLTLALPSVSQCEANSQLQQMLLYFDGLSYQLLDFKTVKKPYALNSIHFYLPDATDDALHKAQSVAEGVTLARRLSDMPANHCTPTYLASQAQSLVNEHQSIALTVFDAQGVKALGMNALLAVAQGSVEKPVFIELSYRGADKDSAPVVLVGKGITFDSGGLTLKPGNVMDEMKYDMAGAASVLGTLHACAALNLPINVVGLIPSAENMPSGHAVKPGDIVSSLSGQTIEILNTDAEGRLILADALTYAERLNPRYVVDIATLTGAIIVALGHVMSGLMTEDDELSNLLLKAGTRSLDRCWRMPLDNAYQEALDSPLADMINARFDRSAGSITAACFLSRFTKKYRWAHLDVAGTAWITGNKRKATGRPVPLLVEFLQQLCHAS